MDRIILEFTSRIFLKPHSFYLLKDSFFLIDYINIYNFLDNITFLSGTNTYHHLSEAATGCVLQEKVFLKISQNSLENTCASLFFNKVAGLRPTTLFKKRLSHRCFPVNFAKFLRTRFIIEHLWWLLLTCQCDKYLSLLVSRFEQDSYQKNWFRNNFKRLNEAECHLIIVERKCGWAKTGSQRFAKK